jgi:hypothetical protein
LVAWLNNHAHTTYIHPSTHLKQLREDEQRLSEMRIGSLLLAQQAVVVRRQNGWTQQAKKEEGKDDGLGQRGKLGIDLRSVNL